MRSLLFFALFVVPPAVAVVAVLVMFSGPYGDEFVRALWDTWTTASHR